MCCVLALMFLLAWSNGADAGEPRVYRDRVVPHWFANQTRFWYRNDLPNGGREFILVDAQQGTRQPAFDHARVAESLGSLLGRSVLAEQLPVERLAFDEDASAVVLRGRDQAWRLELSKYELRETDAAEAAVESLPVGRRSRPTSRTGPETSITFVNQTPTEIVVYWVDMDGQRRRYAAIAPGDQHSQHTFAGHVWLVTGQAEATLGVFEAAEEDSRAVVEVGGATTAKPDSRPRERGGERRSRRNPESPDGKWLVVLQDQNLHLRAKDTGEEFPLSTDGRAEDRYDLGELWWSPDSQKLVALRTEPAQEHPVQIIESSPNDQLQPKLRTFDYLKPGDRIAHPRPQLFDVAARRQVEIRDELFANPWSIEHIRWSADSSRFTFVYNQRGHQVLRVIAIEAATGAARAIVDEKSNTFICYSGKFFCHWLGDDELIWMSERDGWNHLWLYDAKAGQVKNPITEGPWVVQSVVHVDEEQRQVWFRAGGVYAEQDPYYTHFCRVNLDGSGMTVLTAGDGNHRVQWSPGEPCFLDTWSRVDLPPVTELRSSQDGRLVCSLEEADAGEVLAERGGRWPERFVAKGRDGVTDIYGVILRPGDFDPAKKYPVVENIYAGPQDFFVRPSRSVRVTGTSSGLPTWA
jgi:dipeptidyl-peptidase 4